MKGWRTIVAFVVAGLVYLLGWDQLTTVVSPKILAIATTVLGVGLRVITTTPVGTPTPPA